MSTANKLIYLNVTKQKLKQAINNIGGSIDDNTTFREYANQLQNAYDNLPKTEYQEGTEVNLGKTIKGKLDFDNGVVGIGQTEQDGEPTPSTPIDIQCVTGNQDVVVSGINKCSNSNELEGMLINALQSKPPENYIALADVEEGEKYTISFTKSRVEGETIQNAQLYTYSKIEYYNGNTLISTVNATTSDAVILSSGRSVNKLKVITIPTNCDNIKVYLINNNGDYTYNTKLEKVMILKGEYDSSNLPAYEPYITPKSYQLSLGDIQLCGIGDYKDELVYDVDEDKVYKNEFINVNRLLNTWDWNVGGVGTNSYFTPYFRDNTNIGKTGSVVNIICTHAKGIKFDDRNSFSYTTIYDERNGIVMFRNTDFLTLDSFKAFLSDNDVYAYTTTTEPTLTEITDTTLINQVKALYNAHSLNGTTIITSNGDLPMIIKVRGLKGE